jgi:hypothetical protein
MRKVFALALLAMIAAPALADEAYDYTNRVNPGDPNPLSVSQRPAFVDAEKVFLHSSFTDNFEVEAVRSPFTGNASTLWTSEWDANTSVVDPGLGGSTRAARHTSDGSGVSGFELNSPEFGAVYDMAFAATLKISDLGTRYDFVTVDPEVGLFNTRVIFQPNGDIWGTRVNDTQTAFESFDTGFDWTPGAEMDISVEVTSAGDVIVRKDGSVLFTELETTFELSGGAFVGGVGQYLTYASNTDSVSATLDIDNVRFVPEPATLALLVLGGATMIRRRR